MKLLGFAGVTIVDLVTKREIQRGSMHSIVRAVDAVSGMGGPICDVFMFIT